MRRFILLILCVISIEAAFSAPSVQDLASLIDQNQFAKAAQTGEQLLTGNPTHVRIQFLTAYAYQMDEQLVKASKHYRDIIQRHPNLPEPRNNLAMIYLADGDYDRASELLIEAINTRKSYATAYKNLNRIYAGTAKEAYGLALGESKELAEYTYDIELVALREVEFRDDNPETDTLASPDSLIQIANIETLLIERVKNWAKAWSDKNMAVYIGFYSSEYRRNFETHDAWVENRRRRIMHPGPIEVRISNIQVYPQNKTLAFIEFEQAFNSSHYSDRVMKRLNFSRIGSQWKISAEHVLSVL